MNAPAPIGRLRESFLGGSDAAAVLGVSPWATPLDIYLEKTGQRTVVVDAQRERNFKRGKRAEPHAIDMAIEDYGLKVTKRSTPAEKNYYVDPEHSFLAAEIDFEWEVTPAIAERFNLPDELIGTIQNGEVKSVHPFASGKFGDAETDEVPVEYGAQAMHGLMVSDRKLTMFLVLTGWDDLTVYWIRRDDATIAGMRKIEIAFWNDHVMVGVPPKPVNLPDVLNLFGRVPAIRVEASPEIAALVNDLINLRAEQRAAAQGEEEVKFKIGEFILGKAALDFDEKKKKVVPGPEPKGGPHELVLAGATLLSINLQTQQRLDGDKVKTDFPEIADQCMKSLSFYKFAKPAIKRSKK